MRPTKNRGLIFVRFLCDTESARSENVGPVHDFSDEHHFSTVIFILKPIQLTAIPYTSEKTVNGTDETKRTQRTSAAKAEAVPVAPMPKPGRRNAVARFKVRKFKGQSGYTRN